MSTYLLPAPSPAERIQLDLNWLVTRLRKSLKVILLCGVAGAAGGYFFAKSKPEFFDASGMILVQGGSYAIPQLQGALRTDSSADPMVLVRSETTALSSRQLLQQVIDELNLARTPEFNPMLRPPSLQSQIIGSLKSVFSSGSQSVADTQAAARAESDAVFGQVAKNLVVFNDGRSLVISINFTAQDPKLASDVVNAVIRDYTQAQASGRNVINKGANSVLTQQTEDVRNHINDLENQIRALRQKNDLVALPAGSAVQQQLADLATAAAHASTERAQAEALWSRATALEQRGASDELAAVVGSSTISQLRDQQAEASRRLATLQAHYGANYPDVQAARADLESAQRQLDGETQRIVASLGTAVRVARQQEAEVQRQMNAARHTSVKTANQEAELTQLQDEVTAQRTLYATMLASSQQTNAQANLNGTPDIRVISNATPPGFPAGPNTHLAGLLGGLAGLLVGCGISVAFKRGEGPFADAATAAANTNLPVLAVLNGDVNNPQIPLAAHVLASPGGVDAEALRSMRTRLRLAGPTGSAALCRTIMFTSCSKEENAPSVATAFARLAALDGERVLLIEGNLRAPAMKRLLQATGGNLLTVLESRQSWRAAVTQDSDTTLDLLLAGQHSPTSHALLSGDYLRTLLSEAQSHYSWIILDAPPAATSADAMSLVRNVDATVLVVDDTHTTLESVREGVGRLNSVAQNLAGLALLQKA